MNSYVSFCIVEFRKCDPWSLIKIIRHPNPMTIFSNINHAVVSTLQSLIGATSAHLVRYSIAVIIYFSPMHHNGGLMGPTKLISHLSKGFRVIMGLRGISSRCDGFLVRQHTSQALQ